MLTEKLSPSTRNVLFSAKKKAEKETLGLPTFAHLLSSFSANKEDNVGRLIPSLNLKIDSSDLYRTAPLEEILKDALLEARSSLSETVETSHLFLSTLKNLKVSDAVLDDIRSRLGLSASTFTAESPKSRSLLSTFTTNLKESRENLFLRKETEFALKILLRKDRHSVCLTGPKGVGKTTIIHSLARLFSKQRPEPPNLPPLEFLKFETTAFLTAELQNPEANFSAILNEALKSPKQVLFFDDINVFFTPSLSFHGMISSLKNYLDRGLRVVATYDTSEFSRIFGEDDIFTKFFTTLEINETSFEETLEIIRGHVEEFSRYHKIKIPAEVLPNLVSLSTFGGSAPWPEKALDLLDLACVESKVKEKMSVLTGDEIRSVVSDMTGIPVSTIGEEEKKNLLSLEKGLSSEVIGQDEAVRVVAGLLRKARLGLTAGDRPFGSFLFLGPTGVGKTELARALARHFFGGGVKRLNFIKLDMSEFRERHTVSRLIGAPPGYVGFGQGGELTEKVAKNPYSLILVDEMEKAALEVLNLFLQILDEGVLTDGMGNSVDFKHTIVIFTSNVGAEAIRRGRLGFSLSGLTASDHDETKTRLLDELKLSLKPEFLNRLDSVVVFRRLNPSDIRKITELELRKVKRRFAEKAIQLSFEAKVVGYLSQLGFSEEYGARNLKRLIETKVVDSLASRMLNGRIKEGDKVKLTLKEGKLGFSIAKN